MFNLGNAEWRYIAVDIRCQEDATKYKEIMYR
jgi:hypothetical protein